MAKNFQIPPPAGSPAPPMPGGPPAGAPQGFPFAKPAKPAAPKPFGKGGKVAPKKASKAKSKGGY